MRQHCCTQLLYAAKLLYVRITSRVCTLDNIHKVSCCLFHETCCHQVDQWSTSATMLHAATLPCTWLGLHHSEYGTYTHSSSVQGLWDPCSCSCSNQSTEAYTTPTVVEPWHQFVHDVLHGTVGPQVLSRLGLMDEHITSWAVSVGLDILDNAGLADCREEEVHAVAASPSA